MYFYGETKLIKAMMKNYKNQTGIILMALCLSVALGSCVDDLSSEKNILVAQQSSDKTGGAYTIFVSAGHNASVCKNSCVVINGQSTHVPCQGIGHDCSQGASVTLQQVGTAITATTTDTFGLTSEDFFNMPARSLSTGESGNNAYLNIPAQLVERDTATLQFTFTGLFYTNKPEYNNF